MPVSLAALRIRHEELRREGTLLAGGPADLRQRAATYHHLYEDSGGNHVFPLIAAHGALWARGYFAFGMRLGRQCATPDLWNPRRRNRKLQLLADFANALRDINRMVCVDTFANYHLVLEHGSHPELGELIPAGLLAALRRVRQARESQQRLTDVEKREVFTAHFLYEQEHVVGPRVKDAADRLDWPLMKALALRPWLRFSFFPAGRAFLFRDFTSREERIRRGLAAFDLAAAAGWDRVVERLGDYGLLTSEFLTHSRSEFAALRSMILASASS